MEAVISYVILMINQFFAQVTVGTLLFSGSLRRKDHFRQRAVRSFLALFAVSLAVMFAAYTSEYLIVRNLLVFVLLFGLVMVFMKCCYDESTEVLLVAASCGYMTQHIASQIIQIFFNTGSLVAADSTEALLYTLRSLPVFAVVYLVIYYCFGRRCHALHPMYGKRMVGLSVFSLAIVLVLSSVRDMHAEESVTLMVISRLFSMIICGSLLYIRAVIFEVLETETENEILKQINALQKKQFEENQENIELINIKCHDMRHQIARLTNGEEMKEIEEVIDVYDAAVKTGNDALDTLITSKSMYCAKHGIRLTVMADPEAIAFMSAADICSLFGNAIENAIEASMRIAEEENRVIAIRIREKGGMTVITVENNYSGTIEMKDGLPLSAKEDNGYHGFGTKSIIRTAEKYGGSVTITADDMYHLTILLPIP